MDARTWIETNLDTRQGRNESLTANCPFCTDAGKSPDWKYHLHISIEKAVCHCFRCDYGGTLIRLVRDVSGVSYAEATQILDTQPRTGKRLRLRTPQPAPVPDVELPKEYRPLNPDNMLHRPAIQYLRSREISLLTAADFELGFCITGDYGQRVIIPVKQQDKIVGFTARAIHATDPRHKYMTPPGFKATNYLYNFDHARGSPTVIVVEGPADAWKLPYNGVALFTNKMSDAQTLLIVKHWKRVIVMLDRDAQKEAYDIARRLEAFVDARVALLSMSKDPGEATHLEVAEAITSARHGLEALL